MNKKWLKSYLNLFYYVTRLKFENGVSKTSLDLYGDKNRIVTSKRNLLALRGLIWIQHLSKKFVRQFMTWFHELTNFTNFQKIFFLYRKSMRTAHNAFIGTVALSDLMLCTLTLPINLRSMVSENWPFGDQNSEILCSLSLAAQKFPIFLSSMAIILIGWDRYRCVITPGR